MRGILADADCVGQVKLLIDLMQDHTRRELYELLDLRVFLLEDLGLSPDASDRDIWKRCRDDELVLITANRNADTPDSLQIAITESATEKSLPVITITDPYRVAHDRQYAHRAVDKLLQHLFDIDILRGAVRLYIP
jgi:hypothetical protein